MSKVTAYYHIVFCTKNRKNTIPEELHNDLYRFITNQVKDLKCELKRVGGTCNHVHMLVNLHPTVPLSTLVQNVKSRSSGWMQHDSRFIYFEGWASDYYGCTISPEQKIAVVNYIASQKEHHSNYAIEVEFNTLYRYADLHLDNRDMM